MRARSRFSSTAITMAGWLAWAAVGLELWSGHLVGAAAAWPLPLRETVWSLHGLFAAILLAAQLWRPRPWLRGLLAAALATVALVLIALYRYNSAAALLIIPMIEFAIVLEARRLALVYAAVNLLLLAVVLAFRQMDAPFTYVGLHASLQLFAILLVRSMLRTEQARAELTQAHAELLATRGLLAEAARAQERLRLSRELHDVAGHKLTALHLNLGALAHNRQLDAPRVIALCDRLTEELLDDLRAVVHQLRVHDGLDLRRTLERMAAPFPRPSVRLDIDAAARVQTLEQADALLRAFQEGLTNAARHGDADHFGVRLYREEDDIVLDMHDDGRARAPPRAGHGLTGMRERMRALGGDMEFGWEEGRGFRLRVWLPLCP